MLHTKFQLNTISGSGEEVENRFSRWPLWRPYLISNRHDLYNLRSTSCPDAPHQISDQSDKWFWRRRFFLVFSQNAPLRGPKKGQRPHLYNLRSTSCPDAPHQISAQSDWWFGRRSRKFKKSNGQTTDGHTPRHKLSWA